MQSLQCTTPLRCDKCPIAKSILFTVWVIDFKDKNLTGGGTARPLPLPRMPLHVPLLVVGAGFACEFLADVAETLDILEG